MRQAVIASLATLVGSGIAASADLPKTWVDADTGHRVVRLTDEPGSASLYFHQNGYSADGRKLIYTTEAGIAALDLGTSRAKPVVAGRVRIVMAGRKTQSVYYVKDDVVCTTEVDTGATREIGKVPPRGSISTVNADETLLAGTYVEGEGRDEGRDRRVQPQGLVQPANTYQAPVGQLETPPLFAPAGGAK